jgi:hypothetical protein
MKTRKIVQWSVLLALALVAVTASATMVGSPVVPPGSSWDHAINITDESGQWQTLAPGATNWYAVTYAAGTQDEVDLGTNSVGGVSFAVYAPAEITNWANSGVLTPIGVGSYNPFAPSYDLTWAGHPTVVDGGIYYVAVTNNNNTATPYQVVMNSWGLPD